MFDAETKHSFDLHDDGDLLAIRRQFPCFYSAAATDLLLVACGYLFSISSR
jgi:hypothetical protein